MYVLKLDDRTWVVLSEKSSAGYPRTHIVQWDRMEHGFKCDCEHFKFRSEGKPGFTCKHIRAVIKAYGVRVDGEGDPGDLTKFMKAKK